MTCAAPSKSRDKSAVAVVEVCSVRLGKTLFGVPIAHILEIVGNVRPQPVPLAPEFVGGLVHYRGDVLTTVGLRKVLNAPPNAMPRKRSARDTGDHEIQDLLVLENAGTCFGLLVDSVGEVLTVSANCFEPNPTILDERRRALFAGAYKLKDGLLIMLDPERLDPIRLSGMRLDELHSGEARAA